MLSGGNTQFCRGAKRILPQCVRVGLGVQLLQGVHRCGRNVLGRRDPRNFADQSTETTVDVKFVRVSCDPVGRIPFHIMQY